ncbi:excinuclease ABC subunit UvrB [Patescibacteria group bacterium]|nr:excinuclease ABC subunit UvrB [Patescibacteria group bacterium]
MKDKIFKIKSKFEPAGDQPQAITKLAGGLERGHDFQTLLGVTGSGKTFTMANVIQKFNRPVLVIAPNKALAAQLYHEYKMFFPENSVNYFVSYYDYYQPEAYMPITDTYIEKEAMINDEIDRLRHQATSALLTRKDVIIVASVSCIYNLGIPLNYLEHALRLAVGQPIVRGDLIRQLIKMQFERTPGELGRGKFRVRGDVFEIMPASEETVYRIEFIEQKISSIDLLEKLSRKISSSLKEIVVFPPKHFVSSQPEIEQAIKEIKDELQERLKYFNKKKLYLEAERLERRTRFDMEMMKSLGYCHGIENYSRHLTGKLLGQAPDTLLAYFDKKDFLTIIDESHIALPQIRGMYMGDKSRKEILSQYGWRLPSALDNRPLRFEEFLDRVGQVIFTSATPGNWEIEHSKQIVQQLIRPTGLIDPPVEVRPIFDKKKNRTQIDDIVSEIGILVKSHDRTIVNTLTKKQAEDLHSYLKSKKIKSNFLHSDIKTVERADILMDFRSGKFDVLVGVNLLREGLDLPEVSLVAILDADREGFLRSETSLMQIMGRAARNVNGKVILYADKKTGSIKRAMAEVERRREKQIAYNRKHGIKPKTIKKEISRFLDIENKQRK